MIEFKEPRVTDVLYTVAHNEYVKITNEDNELLYVGPVSLVFEKGNNKLRLKLYKYRVLIISTDKENYIINMEVELI